MPVATPSGSLQTVGPPTINFGKVVRTRQQTRKNNAARSEKTGVQKGVQKGVPPLVRKVRKIVEVGSRTEYASSRSVQSFVRDLEKSTTSDGGMKMLVVEMMIKQNFSSFIDTIRFRQVNDGSGESRRTSSWSYYAWTDARVDERGTVVVPLTAEAVATNRFVTEVVTTLGKSVTRNMLFRPLEVTKAQLKNKNTSRAEFLQRLDGHIKGLVRKMEPLVKDIVAVHAKLMVMFPELVYSSASKNVTNAQITRWTKELMSKLVSNPKEKRHLDTLRTNLRKMSMTTLQTYIRSSDDAGAKTMFARYEKAFGAFDAAATVLRDALDVPAQFKKIRKSMMDAFSYIEPAVRMNVVQNLVASSGTERANQVIETILATYKGEMEEIVAWLPKRLQEEAVEEVVSAPVSASSRTSSTSSSTSSPTLPSTPMRTVSRPTVTQAARDVVQLNITIGSDERALRESEARIRKLERDLSKRTAELLEARRARSRTRNTAVTPTSEKSSGWFKLRAQRDEALRVRSTIRTQLQKHKHQLEKSRYTLLGVALAASLAVTFTASTRRSKLDKLPRMSPSNINSFKRRSNSVTMNTMMRQSTVPVNSTYRMVASVPGKLPAATMTARTKTLKSPTSSRGALITVAQPPIGFTPRPILVPNAGYDDPSVLTVGMIAAATLGLGKLMRKLRRRLSERTDESPNVSNNASNKANRRPPSRSSPSGQSSQPKSDQPTRRPARRAGQYGLGPWLTNSNSNNNMNIKNAGTSAPYIPRSEASRRIKAILLRMQKAVAMNRRRAKLRARR